MRIGVVNNLRAGLSRRGVSRLLELLRGYPEVLHIETESSHALPEALGELARAEIDLLVLYGGDGTLQHALTEILSNGESDVSGRLHERLVSVVVSSLRARR